VIKKTRSFTTFDNLSNRLLLFFLPILVACSEIELPQYWLCDGISHQMTLKDNHIEKTYSGSDPVLLELFNQKVFQFFSPALAGAYDNCSTNENILIFQNKSCSTEIDKNNIRKGILDKTTGELIFYEATNHLDLKVIGDGQYKCRYIGNRYDFTPFNHPVNK
jgi:hypothetical protein